MQREIPDWCRGRGRNASASYRQTRGVAEDPTFGPSVSLWYHDHRMDFTGPQVYKGLAGFHLIHDDQEQALGLPARERDVPLMICDRSFARDGSFRYPSLDPSLDECCEVFMPTGP